MKAESSRTINAELADELGSIATFLERVAKTPELSPGALLELASSDPDLELGEPIGSGGLGVVYVARDRKLDREVAVKVQRVSGDEADDDRLLSEARALARVSHPNVVNVFEVRRVDDHFLLLMELVRGPTLREWLGESPRDREAILSTFQAAGAGLAAAHDAGLIHRDFKPDNVIVGDDGRVRVVDFGLAGPAGDGERGGTPAYMAPEQAAGGEVDARADQYAFCVSLLEAITGGRELTAGLRPRWLRRAIDRGLAADPDRRWPDMPALLGALRPPRRWPMVAIALAAVAVAGVLLAVRARAEPLGLFIDNSVTDHRAVLEAYERGQRQLASGHLLAAAESLSAVHGELDGEIFGLELGEATRGIDGFIGALDIGGRTVDAMRLRPDGRRLAIVSNGVTALVDTSDGRVLFEVDGQGPRFIDGDRLLVTATRGGAVTVARSDDGAVQARFDVGSIDELAAGGDAILVSILGGLRAHAADGSRLFEVAEPSASGLSVSADGQRMLVARPYIAIYERSGELVRRAAELRLDTVARLAPDGSSFAVATGSGVAIISVSDGETRFRIGPAPEIVGLEFSASGDRLLVTQKHRVCVWSLERRELAGCSPPGAGAHAHTGGLERIASNRDDGSVEIWDGESGRTRAVLAASRDGFSRVAIAGDGSRVLTASASGPVKIWRGDLDNLDAEISHPRGAWVDVRGDRLLVSGDQRLAIWDLDRPREPARELTSEGAGGGEAALSDDGSVAAWAGQIWEVPGGRPLAEIPGWTAGAAVELDRSGRRLISCAAGVCRMLEASSGRSLWELELAGPLGIENLPAQAIIATPIFGPDGDLVITGIGADAVVDPETGEVRRRLVRDRRAMAVTIAFLGDRRFAVTDGARVYLAHLDRDEVSSFAGGGHGLVAHPDGVRLLVPIETGALLVDTVTGARQRVAIDYPPLGGGDISSDGSLLALAEGGGLIEIAEAASGRVVSRRFSGAFTRGAHFTPEGRLVAITRSRTLIWSLRRETRGPAEVRRAVGRVLDGP